MSKTMLYYSILALVLLSKVGTTLYERSMVVHHGFSVSEYQHTQRELSQEKTRILTELASRQSLNNIKNSSFIAEYAPIKQVLVISSTNNVASLQ